MSAEMGEDGIIPPNSQGEKELEKALEAQSQKAKDSSKEDKKKLAKEGTDEKQSHTFRSYKAPDNKFLSSRFPPHPPVSDR